MDADSILRAFSILLNLPIGGGDEIRNAKINVTNKMGSHATPHITGPNGTIQYLPARAPKNKITKNTARGKYEPLRYPGANSNATIIAIIKAVKSPILNVDFNRN